MAPGGYVNILVGNHPRQVVGLCTSSPTTPVAMADIQDNCGNCFVAHEPEPDKRAVSQVWGVNEVGQLCLYVPVVVLTNSVLVVALNQPNTLFFDWAEDGFEFFHLALHYIAASNAVFHNPWCNAFLIPSRVSRCYTIQKITATYPYSELILCYSRNHFLEVLLSTVDFAKMNVAEEVEAEYF